MIAAVADQRGRAWPAVADEAPHPENRAVRDAWAIQAGPGTTEKAMAIIADLAFELRRVCRSPRLPNKIAHLE